MTAHDRDDGIDLLRVLGMSMIVCLHVLSQGGVMVRYSTNAASYDMVWLLETLCFCSVNIYGLISGWVGIASGWKISRILELYLNVLFYSAGITLAAWIFDVQAVDREMVLSSLFPFSQKTYWYFSAYVGVFFLAPFLNRLVLSLSQRQRVQLRRTVFLVFTVLTMVPKAFSLDPFTLVGGFSFGWLLLLYVYGACMRCDEPVRQHSRMWYIALYFILALISWLFKIGSEHLAGAMPGKVSYARMLITYHAPTIFLCAVFVLRSFAGIRLKRRWQKRVVSVLAAGSFSVYLLHVQPYIWAHVLKGAFSSWAALPPWLILWPCIGAALLIFAMLAAVDLVRQTLFRLIGVRRHLQRLDRYISFDDTDAAGDMAGIDRQFPGC